MAPSVPRHLQRTAEQPTRVIQPNVHCTQIKRTILDTVIVLCSRERGDTWVWVTRHCGTYEARLWVAVVLLFRVRREDHRRTLGRCAVPPDWDSYWHDTRATYRCRLRGWHAAVPSHQLAGLREAAAQNGRDSYGRLAGGRLQVSKTVTANVASGLAACACADRPASSQRSSTDELSQDMK